MIEARPEFKGERLKSAFGAVIEAGPDLEGDAGGDDEGAVGDPLLEAEVVAAVPVAHAQPALAGLRVLPWWQQVDVVHLALPLVDGVRLPGRTAKCDYHYC